MTHGDEADLVVRHARLLSAIGGAAYDKLVVVNRYYNAFQRMMGMRQWSLSQYVKLKVKKACTHIAQFESVLEKAAAERGLDGVVCGHVHKAEIRGGPVAYYNCGDWVESCPALVEHDDGPMNIIDGLALTDSLQDVAEEEVPETV